MSGPCAEPFVQAALDPRRHHAIDLLPFPARRVDLRPIQLGERLIDPSGMLGAVLRFHFRHDRSERFADGRMRRFLREVAVIPSRTRFSSVSESTRISTSAAGTLPSAEYAS